MEPRDKMTTCQPRSAVTKTSLSYHHCFSHKPKQPQNSYSEEKKLSSNPNQDILFLLKRELRTCIKLTNKTVNFQE